MKKKITLKKKILYVICFCLLLYLSGSIYIGLRIESLIWAANAEPLMENPSPERISDENYRRIGYKNTKSIRASDGPDAKEFGTHTPVFTLYGLKGAKSVYVYWYSASKGEWETGGWAIPVWITSEWEDGKWVITDVHEPP